MTDRPTAAFLRTPEDLDVESLDAVPPDDGQPVPLHPGPDLIDGEGLRRGDRPSKEAERECRDRDVTL